MTSKRRIAANRRNALKSRGPRTAVGRSIASRNALRHGLAAMVHNHPPPSAELEDFAKALCEGDDDPVLLAQARIVANNEWVLRAISAQQIAVVERCRDPTAIAFAKGDNSLAIAKARSLKSRQAEVELRARIVALLEQHKHELPPPDPLDGIDGSIIPLHLEEFLESREKDAATGADVGLASVSSDKEPI
jgi:hypothetical protein